MGVFFENCFCDITLVESEFEEAPPLSKPPSPPYQGGYMGKLFEEAFVELETCHFTTEEGEVWFMISICAHVPPVIVLDIREIGEIENIRILESWNV